MQRSVQKETARTLNPSKLATFMILQLRTRKAPARPSKAATELLTMSSGVMHTQVDQMFVQGLHAALCLKKA